MAERELQGATVVITGASSGIGRAAAEAFAREGCNLVLAARRKAALAEVVAACKRLGARAVAVPTDVADADAMRDLARAAIRRFDRIDVWINNAGVGALGEFTDTPAEAHERVIRTNLIGHINGAHAVLPHFKRRESGVLINTLSLGAWVPTPYAAAYSASKFGLRGFSEALRGELVKFPGIAVCDVFPAFMDTPGIAHAANYTGRKLRAAPPVYDARRVADTMVSLARDPRDGATVGQVASLIRFGHFVSPALVRWAMSRFIGTYLGRAEAVPNTDGNLFEPVQAGTGIDGGLRKPGKRAGVAFAGTFALALGAGMVLFSKRGEGA